MDEGPLLKEFPFLVRMKMTSGLAFKGEIQVQGGWVSVAVRSPHYPDLRHLSITHDGEPETAASAPDLTGCSSLLEAVRLYQNYLSTAIDGSAAGRGDESAMAALRRHLLVLRHLRQIGAHCVESAAEDLSWVVLTTLDRCARRHQLRLEIPDTYPECGPQVLADLPAELDTSWHRDSCLLDVFARWEDAVAQFQAFWTVMERIDSELWVLDPEEPVRRDTRRRLVVNGRLSVEVTVDPLYPAAVPGCRFLGSETAAGRLREKLAAEIDSWDEYEDIVENLERLLAVGLVRRGDAVSDGGAVYVNGAAILVDCGICYSYRLDGETPARSCDDERCGQPFHFSCLYEWLRSLPSTRQTLRTVFGECPYCKTPISCEIPSG